MFFEVENTPEHIRRARRKEIVKKESPKEEPRLILAPFSRPPQVIFDDVVIGNSCERILEVFNPSKQTQQITLGRNLPPGLVVHLPGEWLVLEPETCYCLTMAWTPMQPTALREIIRFTNENRGRYDVIVVLKSAMNMKGKPQPKGFKISPGKMKKKSLKKSPVAIYKKKSEVIYKATKVKSVSVVQTDYKVYKSSNKENVAACNDYSLESQSTKCPFDSPSSVDLNFDTSAIFSNMRRLKNDNILQNTYDKSFNTNQATPISHVLKPYNMEIGSPAAGIFDNITFTPLKTLQGKTEKLDLGPKIVLSMNSDSELDDSLNVKSTNKENETHSIICISSSQPNKWLTVNHQQQVDGQFMETPTIPNKKIPNTSSPKELNSPNFSINTDFSRISDLSFFPQRFSTERKMARINNETQELLDDPTVKFGSDTYTKESPSTPLEPVNQMYAEARPPHYFMRDNNKMCRQSLFREYQQQRDAYDNRNYLNPYDLNVWQSELRSDVKSPPRSVSPSPLQSIPEESTQCSDTHVFDKTDQIKTTFTINRTFDKMPDRCSISSNSRPSWSKKAVRAEPELWKMPIPLPRKSLKPKASIASSDTCGKISSTFDSIKMSQNISLNQVGNVYSQSFTVDPFLSSTYFYDEEAVDKFEIEFKRWLNCILTPPADLDSNVEQKIDVGKAWLENRNKEVPAAPTREQVCSVYHNSHRLASLRRAAKALLMSPEITQVFQKLNAQLEKKLIAIRPDRNLHLDVGLQKIIMELLLSYNPLWLRIGLEAIYGLVLPMKSNSDIEGLTTFIIQRMFKNPHLKNKHSKSNAPNMLLPAYMEAIKKFTLKKFFMLVFFLDQAKQRKLISHDPCLFCRNATCKESREILIRFTRELIAGIGDITKHLRPLGYVVCHKQSYLDEYKYAVHNIALDIRDGVRLTKVMEIILMKNGLLNQLRTPPISRLQKIHNVQVALNALKDANFVIVGDITANDVADGHREKTLSLLWQLIHVFRAPLFESAANVIKTWWRKKYAVIAEKRKEQEKQRQWKNTAASVIQFWWRRIQYNRLVEWQMKQITTATITIQKYCRMWLCRTRLRKLKTSVLKIEEWYRSVKTMRVAKQTLQNLRVQREELRRTSATVLQTYVRRWLCMKQYKSRVQKVLLIQSKIRCFLVRKHYMQLRTSVIYVQLKYKSKLLMKEEIKKLAETKKSAVIIQSYYRMLKQRRLFQNLKRSVQVVEERYIALLKMRRELETYGKLKCAVVLLQSRYRGQKCRVEYLRQKDLIVKLQRKVRAQLLMKKERAEFLQLKNATVLLQNRIRAFLAKKKARQDYIAMRKSAILIQQRFKSYILTKTQRNSYLRIRNAASTIQKHYRNLLAMRQQRFAFLNLKKAVILIQKQYRAQVLMKRSRESYEKLRTAIITVQRRFRAQLKMRQERSTYLRIKSSCVTIQRAYRAYVLGKHERQHFVKQKEAATVIQRWIRSCKKTEHIKQQYEQSKQACLTIQRVYRAYIIGRKQRQEYILIRTATICIQKYYRAYIEMKTVRQQYIQLKTATITIQRFYKSYLDTKKQRRDYLEVRSAAQLIQNYYRRYRETKTIRERYCELRKTTVLIQRRYRAICAMRNERGQFLRLKQSIAIVQQIFRAKLAMRVQRKAFLRLRSAAVTLQTRFRAQLLMRNERTRYITILEACTTIQTLYRAYTAGKKQRNEYLKMKQAAVTLQRRYKALLAMRRERNMYVRTKSAAITMQIRFRARCLMLEQRSQYQRVLNACVTIQRTYRAYTIGKKQRNEYIKIQTATIVIQQWYRNIRETRKIRKHYLQIRNAVIVAQLRFRAKLLARNIRRIESATKIQNWYRYIEKRNRCRSKYLTIRRSVIILQSVFRVYILRKRLQTMKNAASIIQSYYRSYKRSVVERQRYVRVRMSVIKLQSHVRCLIERKRYIRIKSAVVTIQIAYRWKRERDLLKKRREAAAVCIQKNYRRYIAQSRYLHYRKQVIFIQRLWYGKLMTRLVHFEFLWKRSVVVKLQAVMRGYLVRKQVQQKKEAMIKEREERRLHWAASKIQALLRGHRARLAMSHDRRIATLRRRWREGALRSTQETLKERNEEAMEVLREMSGIEAVIRAFRSLELLTEVTPIMYVRDLQFIVRHVHIYMSVTNRSISSIEVLKSGAAVLLNLARYRHTGPAVYSRDRIPSILKFMWRFSNSEIQLFCILATYLWVFSKYDGIREDLSEFLRIPEYHKMLVTIKGNVERTQRMASNARNKLPTPRGNKRPSGNQSLNYSVYNKSSPVLPALEHHYGLASVDRPCYFEDPNHAITCLFQTYNL